MLKSHWSVNSDVQVFYLLMQNRYGDTIDTIAHYVYLYKVRSPIINKAYVYIVKRLVYISVVHLIPNIRVFNPI